MIGSVISASLMKSAVDLLVERQFDISDLQGLELTTFDVEAPPVGIDSDLSTAGAKKVAAMLAASAGDIAADLSALVTQGPNQAILAELVELATASTNGYLNFQISPTGLREWLILVLGFGRELEPRDLGRILRKANPSFDTTNAPAQQKSAELAAYAEKFAKLIKEARQPRYDVAGAIELPPLIPETNESAFLRSYIAFLDPDSTTGDATDIDRDLKAMSTRKAIICAGLLTDDLVGGGILKGAAAGELRLNRAVRHANDLARSWQEFLDSNSLTGTTDSISRIRLAFLLASLRLIQFTAALLDFAQARSIAKS